MIMDCLGGLRKFDALSPLSKLRKGSAMPLKIGFDNEKYLTEQTTARGRKNTADSNEVTE